MPAPIEPGRSAAATLDGFFHGKLQLYQPAGGYRIAVDTLWLQAALPETAQGWAADIGAGVGGCAVLAAERCRNVEIVGLEREARLAHLLKANADHNGLTERVFPVQADLAAAPLASESYSWVLTNPPYTDPAKVTASPDPLGRAARHESSLTLAAWLRLCWQLVAPRGSLLLVHRADRLAEILAQLAGFPGRSTVLPIWPKAGRPASRVVVRHRRGGEGPLALLSGLVVHASDGTYTYEAAAILEGKAALRLE